MAHHLPLRLMICAALAASASLTAVIAPGGAATAATVPLTVTCTTLSGGESTQRLSGCTGNGAIAADAGAAPAHGTSVVATMTVTWSNKLKTAEKYLYKDLVGKADTCKAKAKYTKKYLVTEHGTVAPAVEGTTTKGMIGGAIRANVCVYKLAVKPYTIVVVNQGKITI